MSALNSVGLVPSWVSRSCQRAIMPWGHSKSTFAQDSTVLSPPPPLFVLVCFWAPPPPRPPSPPSKVRSFWLELTLSLSVSVLAKFRDKKLNSTCLLRSRSRIFIKWTPWQKCALYGNVLFIEIPSNNHKFSEVNTKSTTCHDFPSPDLLEEPKDGKIKENEKFFSF